MMDGKRRWFGWVAIGLGALALAVALLGRGFGPQMGSPGRPSANMQQQQNAQPQAGPGANAQPGAGQQNDRRQNGPGAGALGAGFCAGAIWGERRQSSQQRSVRADHIPFSGAVLFCSLF